jgi:hypothetical protein
MKLKALLLGLAFLASLVPSASTNWFATLFTKIAAGGTFTQASP